MGRQLGRKTKWIPERDWKHWSPAGYPHLIAQVAISKTPDSEGNAPACAVTVFSKKHYNVCPTVLLPGLTGSIKCLTHLHDLESRGNLHLFSLVHSTDHIFTESFEEGSTAEPADTDHCIVISPPVEVSLISSWFSLHCREKPSSPPHIQGLGMWLPAPGYQGCIHLQAPEHHLEFSEILRTSYPVAVTFCSH